MQVWDQVLVEGVEHPARGRAGVVVSVERGGESGVVRLDAMGDAPAEDVKVSAAEVRFLGR